MGFHNGLHAAARRDARPGLPMSVGKRLAALAAARWRALRCGVAARARPCRWRGHRAAARRCRRRPRRCIPTVNIAPAKGWPRRRDAAAARRAARSRAFASGLDHPRWLLRAAQRRRAGGRDQRAAQARRRQGHQGLGHEAGDEAAPAPARPAPTASRCCATPTATAWPRPRIVFLEGLNSPFGMALVGNDLYVANTDAVLRFPYADGADRRSPRPASR